MTTTRVEIGFVVVTIRNGHTNRAAELISPTVYHSQKFADERAGRYVARKGGPSHGEVAIGVPCYVEVPING